MTSTTVFWIEKVDNVHVQCMYVHRYCICERVKALKAYMIPFLLLCFSEFAGRSTNRSIHRVDR